MKCNLTLIHYGMIVKKDVGLRFANPTYVALILILFFLVPTLQRWNPYVTLRVTPFFKMTKSI